MAYEKLNLQDGQVLDAAALAHMENGIENAVPPPTGNFNQLVTDGAGNVGWAPRLAYAEPGKQYVSGFENYSFTGQYVDTDGKGGINKTGLYYVELDGVVYEAEATEDLIYFEIQLGDQNLRTYPFFFACSAGDYSHAEVKGDGEHTLSIYQEVDQVKTIDPKYLPNGVPVVPVTSPASLSFMQAYAGAWRVQPIHKLTVDLSDDRVTANPDNMPRDQMGDVMYDPGARYQITIKNGNEYITEVTPVYGGFPIYNGNSMASGFELVSIVPNENNVLEVMIVSGRGASDFSVTRTPLFSTTT